MSRDLEWLQDSMAALDRVYFSDSLGAQGVAIGWLRWRPSKANFRFGAYYPHHGKIRINRVLAQLWVPDFVALMTVYHEMLHVHVGLDHDHEFRLMEQKFPHYAQSLLWEQENLTALIEAGRT